METKKIKETKDLEKEIIKDEVKENALQETKEGFETILNNIETLRDLILGNLKVLIGDK